MSKHILIVDDSVLVRRIIRATLEQQNGWEVSGEAANAPEAIEKAQELMPDLIAHDLAMPVMNDLEAARALKRLTACAPADVHQLRRSSRSA